MKTPPFFIGAILLFWGSVAEVFFIAAAMALLVEGARWIPVRWEVGDKAFNRVSDLCQLMIIGFVVWRLMTGWYEMPSWALVKWLPLMLLPLILAQVFSVAGTVNLGAIFMLKRRADAKNRDKPKEDDIERFDLSYAYAVICVLGAAAANSRSWAFYPAILMLAAWGYWKIRSDRYSLAVWAAVLIVSGSFGFAGQSGLHKLQLLVSDAILQWMVNQSMDDIDPFKSITRMGDVGVLKQSDNIRFHVQPGGWDKESLLIQEAVYDVYVPNAAIWIASNRKFHSISRGNDGKSWELQPKGQWEKICKVSYKLKGGKDLLKVPGTTVRLDSLPVDGLRTNPMGAVLIEGSGMITYRAYYAGTNALSDEKSERDGAVPGEEGVAIEIIAEEMGLEELTAEQIPGAIVSFFSENFHYDLSLKTASGKQTALTHFLLNSRTGHCEYFATAAVLLLRKSGIPARYVTGYAIDPLDKSGKWIRVRSRNAHAWAKALIGRQWRIVDATPGDWMALERKKMNPLQPVKDFFSEAAFAYRRWQQNADPAERQKFLMWLLAPLVLFMTWRVFQARGKRFKKNRTLNNLPESKAVRRKMEPFEMVEERFNHIGVHRHPSQTWRSWLETLEDDSDLRPLVTSCQKMLPDYLQLKFDPDANIPRLEKKLQKQVKDWLLLP